MTPSDHALAPSRRTAWFNCYSGIAGDMALGATVDAGADTDELFKLLQRLPISGWTLEFEPVMRNGLAATHAKVHAPGDGVVRTLMHVLGVIEEARLPDRARLRSLSAFNALANVEGRLHRRPANQVHFHEVGGHDAIVDIVGTALALELLDIDTVASSPVVTGLGVVRTSHGLLPNPAPAVVELLAGLPTVGRDVNVELTTPTGAAILKAWGSAFGPMPAMTVEAAGFGAGTKEIDGIPNCTQVVIGTSEPYGIEGSGPSGQPLVVLSTNLDDATGETLAHATRQLLDAGALDAWIEPIVMKQGRPGHILSALCDPALAGSLSNLIMRETGSLGVRAAAIERRESARQPGVTDVAGLPVRVKVSPGRVKAEHSDAARVARITGLPLIEVAARAEAAWRSVDED
ncbi:MAG TPA: nickel pincer cofactor biosynthesis protein LarC, partial [Acidimicrobiales bacterium]|nr:nickel pincer cofactor biosynthesis protein LarC [Acidimicrobiales bacterium]